MKILMLNTFDEVGGAAKAAVRLLNGVRNHKIDAKMLVQFKTGNDPHVICNRNHLRKLIRRIKIFLGLLPVRLYPQKPENNFSPSLLPDRKMSDFSAINPDIIHLHWLCAGFLKLETLGKFKKPLIWTLHDSWPFTGGCHVPFDCERYRQKCGACPILGSSRENDLSRHVWLRKKNSWQDLDLTIVSPSRWLAECAKSSSLFRNVHIDVIPNGLDTDIFTPRNKQKARDALSLPQDRQIILFGALWGKTDPNKGFNMLKQALEILDKNKTKLTAVVFGADYFGGIGDTKLPFINLGRIEDEQELSMLYSAADVFVAPSMLENLPNTIMEAMACGTPCVAFLQGGVPELIEHKISGYLAQAYDTKDLAAGILWVLEQNRRYHALAEHSRQKIKSHFELNIIAQQYSELYHRILAS